MSSIILIAFQCSQSGYWGLSIMVMSTSMYPPHCFEDLTFLFNWKCPSPKYYSPDPSKLFSGMIVSFDLVCALTSHTFVIYRIGVLTVVKIGSRRNLQSGLRLCASIWRANTIYIWRRCHPYCYVWTTRCTFENIRFNQEHMRFMHNVAYLSEGCREGYQDRLAWMVCYMCQVKAPCGSCVCDGVSALGSSLWRLFA